MLYKSKTDKSKTDKPRLLLIDDGDAYAQFIFEKMPEYQLIKPSENSESLCIEDGFAAIEFLEQYKGIIDVVLLDMHFDVNEDRLFALNEDTSLRRTKRFQGVAILREIRARFPRLPVVLLTAVEDLSLVDENGDLASQSMTYILDGDDLDTLRVRITSALQDLQQSASDSNVLWGKNPKMHAVRKRLSVISRGRLPIILEGETGTGKSYLAERFVHMGSERTGPFIVLDLSTLPKDLIPAHLFGSVKGAYTGAITDRKGVFEMAHNGTLFIDEIQNAPLEIQKQLLLVLQDGKVRPLGGAKEIEVDVKVIAGSNTPLDKAVADGSFRPDLYMRLSPATRIKIPPLRERADDLVFFANQFVAKAALDKDIIKLRDEVAKALGLPLGGEIILSIGKEKPGKEKPGKEKQGNEQDKVKSVKALKQALYLGTQKLSHIEIVIPKPAWKMLTNHFWPGNIRELEMVMYNIVTFTLVTTTSALSGDLSISSPRLQVDPGLVGDLLAGAAALNVNVQNDKTTSKTTLKDNELIIQIDPCESLNGVANSVERQYFLSIFKQSGGDFNIMSGLLLGDKSKGRAVRLRFNQLGLKVRNILKV